MKILVTGAKGFIGRNLIAELKNRNQTEIYEFDIDIDFSLLDEYCKEAEFVFHLAGVNRPECIEDFMAGNYGFSATLLDTLKKRDNTCPILLTSSIQAEIVNPYGQSKKACEDLFFSYGQETNANVYIYRLPNVFGKWCRPNYNSVIATFCYNIACGLPIIVNDPGVELSLTYIDDVVEEFICALNGNASIGKDRFCNIPVVHEAKLGEVASLLYSFEASRNDLIIPDMSDALIKKLYTTYLSYIPKDQFRYPLKMNCDKRGSFTEIIRTPDRGQFSVNITKPGIIKGNHWHHTKNEKFIVVSGNGVIRFRSLDNKEVLEYFVSGEKIEVVDIPPGYTHSIENIGNTDLVTLMWCSECYNPERPDTYTLEV